MGQKNYKGDTGTGVYGAEKVSMTISWKCYRTIMNQTHSRENRTSGVDYIANGSFKRKRQMFNVY